jgi:MFS family permease
MAEADATTSDGYAAFRFRDFRLHCAARLIMGVAMSMQAVAIGWYVYSVTKSPLALGLTGLSTFLPSVFFALFTGHVADTYNRRVIVTICFSVFAAASLGLLTLVLSGASDVRPIYLLTVIGGTARAFSNPAAQSLTPNTVPREHFANAVTWYSSAWSASRIVGPALGGLAYILGPAVPFSMAFVCFCVATTCVYLISTSGSAAKSGRGPITWATLSAGLHFIWSRKVLLGSISLDLVAVLFGGAVALLPIVAQDILNVGPWGLGLLRASPSVGAILMGAALAHWPIRSGAGKKMLFAVGCYGVATVLFGMSHHLWLSMLMLACVGASDQISVVVRHTMVQAETPDEMRGRVAAVNSIFISGSSDLGEFESGVTAAWWGTVPAIVFGGAATLCFAAGWGALFPALRNRNKLVEK